MKRGKEYCDDQLVINPQNSKELLYRCYADTKVANSTYADAKCDYNYPKNSPDAAVRQQYAECRADMGVPVSGADLC